MKVVLPTSGTCFEDCKDRIVGAGGYSTIRKKNKEVGYLMSSEVLRTREVPRQAPS